MSIEQRMHVKQHTIQNKNKSQTTKVYRTVPIFKTTRNHSTTSNARSKASSPKKFERSKTMVANSILSGKSSSNTQHAKETIF